MKSFLNRGALFGLLVTGASLLAGCKNGVSTAHAESAPPVSNVAVAPAVTPPPANAEITSPNQPAPEKPLPADPSPKPPPPEVKLSSNAQEVVKLAQAGVDESVMLSFVTNSIGAFNLGSEEIIYLKDLGVENTVLTAMIEHDRALGVTTQSISQPTPAAATQATNQEASPPPTAAETAYAAQPTQPVTVNHFYSSLAPYGSWIEIDGYGRCWQPTVAVIQPAWQPYCDRGHWVYTDCGWYWYSDYSWGYHTFHYGRWFRHHRYGWCWYPDTVWGPAWVTWRYSDDYCGWAPLPPYCSYRPGFGFTYYGRSVGFSFNFGLSADCYAFVPVSRFCDPHPYRHRAPRTRIANIYNNTTVINNYISGNNNTVINNGIPVTRVAAATRTPIRPVAIRETSSHPLRGEHAERRGNETVIYRPPASSTLAGASRRSAPALTESSRPSGTSRLTPTETAHTTIDSRRDRERNVPSERRLEPTRPSQTTTTTTTVPQRGTDSSRRGSASHSTVSSAPNREVKPVEQPRITLPRRGTETATTPSKPESVIGNREVRPQERAQPRPTPSTGSQTVSRSARESTPPSSIIFRGNRERNETPASAVQPERPVVRQNPVVTTPRTETPRARSSELPRATVVNPSPTVVTPTPATPTPSRVEPQPGYRPAPTISPRVERPETYRRPEPTITPRVIERPQPSRSSPSVSQRQTENNYSVPSARSQTTVSQPPQSIRAPQQNNPSRGTTPPGWSRSERSKDRP